MTPADSGAPTPAATPINDTIVAISTPAGRGGIGIVRLSGALARSIAESLVRLRHPLAPARARLALVVDDHQAILDEAVVTLFAAPHSYTSEDVVEIAAHGSPIVLALLVRRAIAAGARLAEPGEFTQRAFLSGRLDLTQAEAVRDLIDASTLNQARVAARQLGGALSREIAPVKHQLVTLIAALEAGVDFAEDDIDTMPSDEIVARIAAIEAPLRQLQRGFDYGRILHDGLRLAIVGRPNAGKSSLFNRLVERDRAIVTATPGTTRDLVTERVAVEGIPIELIDTAGLREATDEAESLGIAKSREAMAEADLVLIVLDASQPMHAEDAATLSALEGRPALIAANKIDLAAATGSTTTSARATGVATSARETIGTTIATTTATRTVQTSAITGEGIAQLRRAIVETAGATAAEQETALVTNLRQRQTILTALTALERATTAAAAAIPHEMLLIDLYDTLSSLDALTGATTADDILHLIFSTFCIRQIELRPAVLLDRARNTLTASCNSCSNGRICISSESYGVRSALFKWSDHNLEQGDHFALSGQNICNILIHKTERWVPSGESPLSSSVRLTAGVDIP
ncbi:tRNA uridine-5-carboxymethylaminomethyl(34) synthesis GTPase MnmE [Edaphobacter sp.]|uniref:tRNA uridine-5-carboxymethylaminomethyl(34) synthesis GTPase MnmE n=1 Tax=Edaphobacter sp. TaxID=1934404 RepID=UPI00345BCB0A